MRCWRVPTLHCPIPLRPAFPISFCQYSAFHPKGEPENTSSVTHWLRGWKSYSTTDNPGTSRIIINIFHQQHNSPFLALKRGIAVSDKRRNKNWWKKHKQCYTGSLYQHPYSLRFLWRRKYRHRTVDRQIPVQKSRNNACLLYTSPSPRDTR